MNNAFNAGQNIGSVLGDLFTGKNRQPGQSYYDGMEQGYEIQGKKSRAEQLFEDAARSRDRNIARSAVTADVIARARAGDAQANAALGEAILRSNESMQLTDYTKGALDLRELGVRDSVQEAATRQYGAVNGGLASLANGPLEVNTIDDGYQLNKYELGGNAIPTQGKVAEIDKVNREVYDNGTGVYSLDFSTNSATPITVGSMPALGDPQAQYAALGDKHGFQTTSVGRTPEGNARANGVKNSQHLGDSPTARDFSIRGKTQQQVQAFLSDLRRSGYEAFVHDAGSGQHVHAELPPGSRRGTPSLLSGKPGGGTSDKAPSGYRWSSTGNLEAIPGGPADKAGGGGQTQVIDNGDGTQTIIPGGKTTEDMNKSAGYALRMEKALEDIAASEKIDPSANRPGIGVALANILPDDISNFGKSGERQNVEAAQLDALDAALTLNTGAAYTKEQLKSLRKAYFPQPGDEPATIEAKKSRLESVIQTARLRARTAYPGKPATRELGAPKPGALSVGHVEDGYRYKGGDPASQSSWVKI